MKLLLVMALAWVGTQAQPESIPAAEPQVPEAESVQSEEKNAFLDDFSEEEAPRCSCDLEPLMPPVTPDDILCCHRRVIADLVAGDFSPDSPEFVSAIKRANVLVRGIENRMIMVQETDLGGTDSISLEQLVALLRINIDRIHLVLSPRIRDVFRRRDEKPDKPWSDADRELLAEVVQYAVTTMQFSYFDDANLLMGTLWRRGVDVAGDRLDLATRMRELQTYQSSSGKICENVEIVETPRGQANFLQADDYLSRALGEAGKNGLVSTNVRANILADRARLRVTVSSGNEEEEKWLLGSIRDLQDAFRGGLTDGKIRDASNEVYGFALKRLACKYIKDEDYRAALQLIGLLNVEFEWTEKAALYLLLARDAALRDGRPVFANQLFGKGYQLLVRKLDVGYLDLAEGWPLEFFGKMFGMNSTQLRVKERKVAKKTFFREVVSTHLQISPYDCHLLREYLKALKEIPAAETMTQARSITVRVGPEVCLFSINPDESNEEETK